MKIIDLHAHVTPGRFQAAIRAGRTWHGLGASVGELDVPGFRRTTDERLTDMDALGVDIQAVSPNADFYQYHNDPAISAAVARECNDEIAEIAAAHPDRFVGLGTLPMQDVSAATTELDRVMGDLRFKGVMVGDHVNGRTYDEPEFASFWAAAERLGAVVFFHQGQDTVVTARIDRYHLDNSVGNLTEWALTFGALVGGGLVDRHPRLKLLLGHAGGYVAYGIARMDKAWAAARELVDAGVDPAVALGGELGAERELLERSAGSGPVSRAPSAYLRSFYYDCCTYTGATLRFLVDTVGIDRVVFGTDYPAPMAIADAVNWIRGLDVLSRDEQDAILARNPAQLLGLEA
ncbi:MAG: amidohydrolase family protein [Chloroflexota bacterium]|nr:amidohydrolase family protein [Chloroflexota bacterium]